MATSNDQFSCLYIALTALLSACSQVSPPTPHTHFQTSFEMEEPIPLHSPIAPSGVNVRTSIGRGPQAPYTAKANVGYSGQHALHYQGEGTGGRITLFAVDIPVSAHTILSWMVLPEILGEDPVMSTLVSTGVSLDLLFDDGRRLSELGARDQHGVLLGAAAQAHSNTLYPQQWVHKQVRFADLPALSGRRITAIELELVPVGGGPARGWLDDIRIADQPQAIRKQPSDYVLTTRGTHSNGTFSRGNNLPATALPHGFNFWTPVTDAGTLSWLYRWHEGNDANNRPRLQAFALSHQPSPWVGDRQTFQIMPSIDPGIPDADREKRALAFTHENELARPHHYRVDFDNGIRAEIAPADHAAILRFRFPENAQASLLFDNLDEHSHLILDQDTQTLSGYTDTHSWSSNGATRMFFHARFNRPWADSGLIDSGRATGYVRFGHVDDVTMQMATSLISAEQARRNLDMEIGERDFATIRDTAQAAWDEILGRVQVTGASEDQLITLYSNLYRLFLYPNSAHENVHENAHNTIDNMDTPDWQHANQSSWEKNRAGGDTEKTSAAIIPGKVYVNNGFWDTFRTAWPAYALFTPVKAGELVDGFLQQYRDGGWVSRWSAPGYSDSMVGTSSDVAFADAALKGVTGFDLHVAYAAALRNATTVPPVAHVGRKGSARSMYLGYTDSSSHEGMSWSLESALNDFGIANLAAALAISESDPQRARRYHEEAEYFRIRAASYVSLFDQATGFFRGRKADGTWWQPAEAFDPRIWGGDYTEANAWNFAFTAAHDGVGLAHLYGGPGALAQKLDAFFSTPETAEVRFQGRYQRIIHEMTEARDVRMGMYAHSNQPSHHIPWLYLYTGQPWKTQQMTREILHRLYLGSEIGQGYPGDEDNGEMSAWYLLSMLGLYPLRMGTDEYVIGSPLFERAEVKMDNGHTLRVIAHNNNRENVYVQSLKVNGQTWNQTWLNHAEIAQGGTLEFVMGPEPSTWGSELSAQPPALTEPGNIPRRWFDHTRHARVIRIDHDVASALVDDDAMSSVVVPAGASVIVQLEQPEPVEYYTLTNGSQALTGVDWTLEGRSGDQWQELDARQAQDFPWVQQLRPFQVAHPGTYQEYRLRFSANAPVLEWSELELLQIK